MSQTRESFPIFKHAFETLVAQRQERPLQRFVGTPTISRIGGGCPIRYDIFTGSIPVEGSFIKFLSDDRTWVRIYQRFQYC